MNKRTYKDNLFKFIFGRAENKKWLLSLYNALSGLNCRNENDLELTTIEDIIYINRKNDVSFLIGGEMYLLEHQSSFNPNMPLRGLLYFAQLYNRYLKRKKKTARGKMSRNNKHRKYAVDLYGRKLVKIPAPKFYVLYNGEMKQPDRVILRLSDAFESSSEGFEWTAIMLNVNFGHNRQLLKACKSLQDYSKYVKMVRDNVRKKKMTTNEAVNKALDDAIGQNLLDGFFEAHRAEVLEMCLTEFDQRNYDINRREEGYEDGFEAGKKRGVKSGEHKKAIETAKTAFSMGLSIEQIVKLTNLPMKQLASLQAKIAVS